MNKPQIGEKIGEGGIAQVYEWDDGRKVIKVGKSVWHANSLQKEFEKNRVVWEMGLPAPQPFEYTEFDGSPAIVSERIFGKTLMQTFMEEMTGPTAYKPASDLGGIVKVTAKLLCEVHRHTLETESSQRDRLKYSIRAHDYLTAAEKERVIEKLDGLPMKTQLCHGDPNPGNIIVRESDGKAIFIDWMDASVGNPEADLAEFIIMIRHAVLPEELPSSATRYFDTIREPLIKAFCDEYERLAGIVSYRDVEDWLVPVAARKLNASAIGEKEKQLLVRDIRERLQES